MVIRQPDLDSLPDQTPSTTPAGRPTLKKLTRRDRMLWWLTTLGSNIIATLKEAFATAPAITAIDLAALTRIPDTQRLGIIAYGRWTRQAVETTPWRLQQDALRFLDIGQDVACSITTTASGNLSTQVKPLDTGKVTGLRALLESLQDEAEPATASLARIDTGMAAAPAPAQPPADPYQLSPFAQWHQWTQQTAPPPPQPSLMPAAPNPLSATPYPQPPAPQPPAPPVLVPQPPTTLVPGQTMVLPEAAHPLPPHVHRVVVSVNMDADTGLTCAELTDAYLETRCITGAAWYFPVPADPHIKAMVMAEFYRHTANGAPVWKLRAVAQGWSDVLDGLARAYGVQVDDCLNLLDSPRRVAGTGPGTRSPGSGSAARTGATAGRWCCRRAFLG